MIVTVCVGVMHVFRAGERAGSWTAAVEQGVLWKPCGTWSWSAALQSEWWNHWIPQTTAYANGHFRVFHTKLTLLKCFRHPQLPVCESQLVILIVYRWSYEVVSCCVTNTEFNGSIHVVVYISASRKLGKSETGRYNFLEVEAVAEHSKQKLPARGQKNPKKGDLS